MWIVLQEEVEYTLGQWRGLLAVGIWCLGQWQWGSILWELVEGHSFWARPLLLFHCPPQSTRL